MTMNRRKVCMLAICCSGTAVFLLSGCAYNQHMVAERARANRLGRQLAVEEDIRRSGEGELGFLLREKKRLEREIEEQRIELKKIRQIPPQAQDAGWKAKIAAKEAEINRKQKEMEDLGELIY